MTHFLTVWQGFVIMITCIMISMGLTLFTGVIMDTIDDKYNDLGVYDQEGVWGDQLGGIRFFQNVFYFVPFLISGFGIVTFVVSILKRQEYDNTY